MTKEPILLIGCGGHAVACIDVIEQHGQYNIVGLVGKQHEVDSTILGYRVLGADNDLMHLLKTYTNALIAVGQIKSPALRIRLHAQVTKHSTVLPSVISPYAYVSPHAHIAAGSIVMHGAIINAGATIGKNCIINSKALIEHGSKIDDHCHIATAATINGDVSIGSGTFIGSGSIIREGQNIGKQCVIGMGQKIHYDCPDNHQIPIPEDC
ncbi:MAG: acetyltransferase [bacterium]